MFLMVLFILGSGDFVMAELQSKLKGRGKVEPACSLAMKNKATAALSRRPSKNPEGDKLEGAPSFQKELRSSQDICREESAVPLESTQQMAVDGKVRTMCLNLELSSGSSVTEEGTSPSSAVSCKPTIVDVSVLGEEDKSVKTAGEDYTHHTKESFSEKAFSGVSSIPQHRPKSPHAMRMSPAGSQPKARTPYGKPIDVLVV